MGIILSLFLLMFMAYRGFSVIFFAPVFALLAAVLQGLPIMPSYTELFMGKAVGFIKSFSPRKMACRKPSMSAQSDHF